MADTTMVRWTTVLLAPVGVAAAATTAPGGPAGRVHLQSRGARRSSIIPVAVRTERFHGLAFTKSAFAESAICQFCHLPGPADCRYARPRPRGGCMAMQARQELTRALAEFAASLGYDDLPQRSREHCKNLILDALACAVAGRQGEETGQVLALASALAQGCESSVIGGGRLSLAGATLFNGYLITAVTMCDVHRATMTHITPEIVPPALAIAERDDLPSRDLLVAVA